MLQNGGMQSSESFSAANLIAGILFGLVGLYVLRIAKKDANLIGISLGLALMIYPYFVTSAWANFAIGLVLSVLAVRSLRES